MAERPAEEITIRFETWNSAFDESPHLEIARILRDLGHRIGRSHGYPSGLYDVNGNRIGEVTVKRIGTCDLSSGLQEKF